MLKTIITDLVYHGSGWEIKREICAAAAVVFFPHALYNTGIHHEYYPLIF
jgi:hypothetical protein